MRLFSFGKLFVTFYVAFLSGRLTSSSDLASYGNLCSISQLFGTKVILHSCGDVIPITSWAPDVVNLVCP